MAHPKGHEIFRPAVAVMESGDVLVCTLVGGKVTYVHKSLWPVLVRLSHRFNRAQLAKVWSEHTPSGAHVKRRVGVAYPRWVPPEVLQRAKALTEEEAAKKPGVRELLREGRPARPRS
jgi:hypothetical protein